MSETVTVGAITYTKRDRRWEWGACYRVDALHAVCLDALATAQRERAEWEANAQRENAALVQAQQENAKLEQDREDVRKGLKSVADLIAESEGVYGLHLNGDVSPWSELRAGGRYEEWLADFDAALGRMLKEANDADQ